MWEPARQLSPSFPTDAVCISLGKSLEEAAMDMLRTPWIRPVVEERLREIIRWRGTENPEQTKDGYQIIGDSVWVKMGGAQPLQITTVGYVCFSYSLSIWRPCV